MKQIAQISKVKSHDELDFWLEMNGYSTRADEMKEVNSLESVADDETATFSEAQLASEASAYSLNYDYRVITGILELDDLYVVRVSKNTAKKGGTYLRFSKETKSSDLLALNRVIAYRTRYSGAEIKGVFNKGVTTQEMTHVVDDLTNYSDLPYDPHEQVIDMQDVKTAVKRRKRRRQREKQKSSEKDAFISGKVSKIKLDKIVIDEDNGHVVAKNGEGRVEPFHFQTWRPETCLNHANLPTSVRSAMSGFYKAFGLDKKGRAKNAPLEEVWQQEFNLPQNVVMNDDHAERKFALWYKKRDENGSTYTHPHFMIKAGGANNPDHDWMRMPKDRIHQILDFITSYSGNSFAEDLNSYVANVKQYTDRQRELLEGGHNKHVSTNILMGKSQIAVSYDVAHDGDTWTLDIDELGSVEVEYPQLRDFADLKDNTSSLIDRLTDMGYDEGDVKDFIREKAGVNSHE